VLRLPPESSVLHDLINLTDARVPIPTWWPLKQKLYQHAAGLIGKHMRPEDMTWGTFGPLSNNVLFAKTRPCQPRLAD